MTAAGGVRVLLLAGGQSEEHEVSLSSARGVLSALEASGLAADVAVITREGRWLPPAESRLALGQGTAPAGGAALLQQGGQVLARGGAGGYGVVFPLLHGPMGEDGTVQGLLTLAGLPFVGSGVLGSAASMDKAVTKEVLRSAGIPQLPYALLRRAEWRRDPDSARAAALALGLPLFVKPANMGSSVGVSKVSREDELDAALELAFAHDRRVIAEAMTAHKPREVEIGVLGNDQPQASVPGELRFDAEFYDYDTKYKGGRAELVIPAELPHGVAERVREHALTAFGALDCAGLARVDFFWVEETGELYLNELNTMPGFTPTSMFPRLWAASGVPYPELVRRLVELALEPR